MADENIDLRLNFDDSGVTQGTSNVNDRLKIMKETLETVQKSFNSSFQAAYKDLEKVESGLGNTSDAIVHQDKRLKDAAKTFNEYGRSIGESITELGILNGGILKNIASLRAKINVLSNLVKGFRASSKAAGTLAVSMISIPILAIVAALGALVSFLTKTQRGMDLLSTVTASVSAVFAVVVDRISLLGESLIKLFQGDFKGAANIAKQAVSGIAEEITRVAAVAATLENATQRLRDQQIEFITEQARLESEIAEAREKISDETLSLKERQDALNRARQAESTLTNELIRQKQEELRIMIAKNALSESSAEDVRNEKELAAEIFKLQARQSAAQRTFNREQKRIRSEAARAAKQAADEEKARLKAIEQANLRIADLFQQLEDTIKQGNIDNLTGIERINAEYEFGLQLLERQVSEISRQIDEAQKAGVAQEEIQIRRLALIDFERNARRLAEQEFTKQITAEEEKRRQKRIAEFDRQNEIIFNIAKKAYDKRKKDFESNLDQIDFETELALLEVDLLEKSTSRILSLEEDKERKRLQIILESQKRRLSAIEAFSGDNSPEAILLRKQIEVLQREIDNIEFKGPEDPLGALKESLANALGFTTEQMSAIGNAIGAGFQQYLNSVNQLAQQSKEKLDEVRGRREQVAKELDDEEERRRQGLANNVDAKRTELNQISAEEARAQQEAEKRQKQATRAQLIAEGAQQLSAITTAVANIIKGFSTIPIVGTILGIAAGGAMLGSWIALKSKAKDTVKLSKGDYLGNYLGEPSSDNGRPSRSSGMVKKHGRSDRHGRGYRIEGTNIEIGGDEFLTNGETTQRQLAFLNKLNSHRYDRLDLVNIAENALKAKDFTKSGRMYFKKYNVMNARYNGITRQEMEAISKRYAERLIHFFENRQETLIPLSDGRYMKKKGNRITISKTP